MFTELNSIIGIALATLVVGSFLGFLIRRKWEEKEQRSAEGRVTILVEEAEKKAGAIKKEAELSAKDLLYRAKMEFEEETKNRRQELQGLERRLLSKEDNLDKKFESIQAKESDFRRLEKDLEEKNKKTQEAETEYRSLVEESKRSLERVSGLSSEEARRLLMDQMLDEAKHEAAKKIKQVEDEAKEQADVKAKKVISLAIERMAGEWVQERAVSVVNLPSDDMKGRIIGREGRNIRSIEALTGVDLVIDDTPGAVVLSSHNPIRREVARISLERLLQDGRIHPARIEEIVQKTAKEIDQSIREAGQQALFELEIHNVHPEIVKLLGTLKYRYSYAQNVLRHSIEVGFMAGIMASELGLNMKVARRAGLLHDIGKAVSHEIPGSHAVIGGEFAKKYGETQEVWHAVWAHHEDIPQESVMDHLVEAADALSGARPGARMEQTEAYIKRLEELEKIALSFPQVEKAYGIQAGRELRVMVQPDKINDSDALLLCKDIIKRIESELTYPGQIKVTIIRETRAVDYAR
ncbi:MAG: ribonuclease Y [Deltaproteobacteria bacterium]|nr:ribonuclease Y [Deltaproteobacteria bacterium]